MMTRSGWTKAAEAMVRQYGRIKSLRYEVSETVEVSPAGSTTRDFSWQVEAKIRRSEAAFDWVSVTVDGATPESCLAMLETRLADRFMERPKQEEFAAAAEM